MTGLRERKKLEAWYSIRTAAWKLFAESDFDSVSVDQIANEAHVSRATFFKYFPNKEAVVFANAPDEQEAWRCLMDAVPKQETLWQAIASVLIDFTRSSGEIVTMRRQLKVSSPHLVTSGKEVGELFRRDLLAWAEMRHPGTTPEDAMLHVNLALAAVTTAYQIWPEHAGNAELISSMRACLNRAGGGLDRGLPA